VQPATAAMWAKQDQHEGDRWRLFGAVGAAIDATTVLYPGSYVDIAPSFVFESVTYVDVDKRTPRFFGDVDGVAEIIGRHGGPTHADVRFLHADYTAGLDLPDQHFDLLISLYGGFVSEHCTRHLRVGGTLLVNPSHGDAALASIDDRYELAGVVISRDGDYRVSSKDLDAYLVPTKPQAISAEILHRTRRGVAYTKPAFAYLFARVRSSAAATERLASSG